MAINNVINIDSIVSINEDMLRVCLSSVDCTACKLVHSIIMEYFGADNWIYKFISFEEDLRSRIKFFNKENVRFFEEKKVLKFFSKAYPELHAEITTPTCLWNILCGWTSTVYHTQVLYITDNSKKDDVFEILRNDTYKDIDSISSVWMNVKMVIRNQQEAKNHNTFEIYFHKEYLNIVKKVLAI